MIFRKTTFCSFWFKSFCSLFGNCKYRVLLKHLNICANIAIIAELLLTLHRLLGKFMKTILFLHGFFASGQCQPAVALREAFEGRAEVISPDLPTHPKKTLVLIRDIMTNAKASLLHFARTGWM